MLSACSQRCLFNTFQVAAFQQMKVQVSCPDWPMLMAPVVVLSRYLGARVPVACCLLPEGKQHAPKLRCAH